MDRTFLEILHELGRNDVLWISIVSSTLAQFLKPFTYYIRTREFDWRYIAHTGGFPSSHSAMVSALAVGFGMTEGFDSMLFAGAVILATIVVYDAANVRREAGTHARMLNLIVAEVLRGHQLEQTHLREVLGHTYQEVIGGVVFGISVMMIWELLVQPLFA